MSSRSYPASTFNIIAASVTLRVRGPQRSSDSTSGMIPRIETRPYVGFSPTTLQYDAGVRMEPPVSVPSAPKQRSVATAAADPPDDPPGLRSSAHGLRTAP